MRKTRHATFAIAISLTAIATLAPLSFTPKAGAALNDACAGGGCCRELGSICDGGLAHYRNDWDGVCKMKTTSTTSSEEQSSDSL